MNKPHSLYIHIPFCERLCDYCDFIKLQYFRNFAVSYLKELEREMASYQIDDLKTIYVGGGTPTALDDDLLLELLKMIEPYTKGVKEYTFEANPESLSESKIKLLKQFGVNRISLGVQSTDDTVLKHINRQHSFKDVQKAVALLKENGIDNINADLILGLPHSSQALLRKDLENILSLGVKHISCYALTIHPHTVLYNQGYQEMDADLIRKLYDVVDDFLLKRGFVHYEVSNWCLPGFASQHNLTYWRNERYYGVGLGVAGYVENIRYKNTANLDRYLKGEYLAEKEIVDLKDEYTYQVMCNLRTNEGLDLDYLKQHFNIDLLATKKAEIEALIEQGFIINENSRIIATYEGLMILDTLILKLL